MLTDSQIKAINDAMSLLINCDNLLSQYGPGCIETERDVHMDIMVDEGVPQDICDHFWDIISAKYGDMMG